MHLGGSGAAAVLARARAVTDPALRSVVASLPAAMRRVAAYHFGWQRADGSPDTANAGKAVRPALTLATASAFGADPEEVVPAAVAVELVHNFTLLHDDVMDRDLTRRHRPTAWSVFGSTDAILAGDALQALALRTLVADGRPAATGAVAALATCIVEACEGQHADCSFEARSDVTLAECLTMAETKTGAVLGCACALGALYAGADAAAVAAMDAFGRQAGLAFQLVDDLIGIWGNPAFTGKPAGADLVVRKKSLPVVAALTSATDAAAELADLYNSDRPLTAREVRRAADLVDQAGGRAWAVAEAGTRVAAATLLLAETVPQPAEASDLLALADLVIRRDH
jgi:geranylgeranyl diphosphate synthase type I